MLVKIGTTDISKYVNESNYNVNSKNEYTEWTDANYSKHRVFTKKRVSGSFTIHLFSGWLAANDFLTLLSTNTVSGLTNITLHINNENADRQISAYVDTSVDFHRSLANGYIDKITVNIEEM